MRNNLNPACANGLKMEDVMAPKYPILAGIIMGSISDRPLVEPAKATLEEYEVLFASTVASGHRTPKRVEDTVKEWEKRGCKVFICAAGMAAHLAGIVASHTTLPVIAVPLASSSSTLGGLDALLASVQMPPGVPVMTMAINGAKNAAIAAIQILAIKEKLFELKLKNKRIGMVQDVEKAALKLADEHGWPA
ncbi:MAG: N5-carboxyaminoimidazole ribonucleotide mutase [Candidatus Moranbacteria bacterium GW2011_GWF2_44_10]|nr:MAG: N5-carboxyaminoimidazole ribonucleotide mutase [Candidatus Moranbacteria bacterium GW2011_GWF2_44_10]